MVLAASVGACIAPERAAWALSAPCLAERAGGGRYGAGWFPLCAEWAGCSWALAVRRYHSQDRAAPVTAASRAGARDQSARPRHPLGSFG